MATDGGIDRVGDLGIKVLGDGNMGSAGIKRIRECQLLRRKWHVCVIMKLMATPCS